MFFFRPSLRWFTPVAFMVCAAPVWGAEGLDAVKAALRDFVKTMDGIKRDVSADMGAAALVGVLERWAGANEMMAKELQAFASKNPEYIKQTQTPPEMVDFMAQLEKAKNDFQPTSQAVRRVLEKHKSDPAVQKAMEKFMASLGSVKKLPE